MQLDLAPFDGEPGRSVQPARHETHNRVIMSRRQGRERRLGGERGVLRRGTPGQKPIKQLRVG